MGMSLSNAMEVNCFNCMEIISSHSKKYFIFEKDSSVDKCLVYKINQLTEAECLLDKDESYICGDCRGVLVEIFTLEKKFKEKSKPRNDSHYELEESELTLNEDYDENGISCDIGDQDEKGSIPDETLDSSKVNTLLSALKEEH